MSPQHDEEASFLYLDWQELYNTEKPFQIFSAIPEHAIDQRATNLVFKAGPPEHINDIRGNEASFSLDVHGFAVRKHVTSLQNFENVSEIESVYLREIEELLKSEVEDVDQVFLFDWRVGYITNTVHSKI